MTREKAIEILKEIIDTGWLISDFEKCVAIDACEMAIEALEQEPILDKIRTEIEFKSRIVLKDTPNDDWTVKWNECIKEVLEIIDKYKAESEE